MLLVEAMFDKLKGKLGETFTLRQIQQHIEQERDRPLYIRSLPMNSKTTGYCVFLKDVDLIVTRAGLDRMLELGGQGHEMAHILLHKNQVPRYPVTLEEFLKNP